MALGHKTPLNVAPEPSSYGADRGLTLAHNLNLLAQPMLG